MKTLKIIANIVVKKEFNDTVYSAMTKLVDCTRTESGCIYYALHRDTKNPFKYIMLETWESQSAIDSHNASEHFKEFSQFAKDKLECIEVSIVEEMY